MIGATETATLKLADEGVVDQGPAVYESNPPPTNTNWVRN